MSAPQSESTPGGVLGGAVAWMANNSVAANLLLLLVFAGGVFGAMQTKQEVFPEFDLDVVSVTVPYPGASPEEVEQGVVYAVEEAVRGLDGVKRVSSVSNEGVGNVTVELFIDADADAVTADVKAAVDRIQSFPDESEDPIVQAPVTRRRVVTLLLAADTNRRALYEVAESVRTDLLATGEITQIDHWGLRRLAYTSASLKNRRQGYYVIFQFSAASTLIDQIEQTLKLDESVLRYLLTAVKGEFIHVPQLVPDNFLEEAFARPTRGPRDRGGPRRDRDDRGSRDRDDRGSRDRDDRGPRSEAPDSEPAAAAPKEAAAEVAKESDDS